MALQPQQFGALPQKTAKQKQADQDYDEHQIKSWHADGSYLSRLHSALESSPSRRARGGGPNVR